MDQAHSTNPSYSPYDGAVLSSLAKIGRTAHCKSREWRIETKHWTEGALESAGSTNLLTRAGHTHRLLSVYRPVFGCIICQLWVLSFNWSITVVKMLAQLSSCVYVSFWLENIFMS